MGVGRALRLAALCGGFGALAPGANAQAPPHEHGAREPYHLEARRADRAPAIDGVLDEAVWQAAVVDAFTQQEPSDGAPATERTEVRLLYDAEHLYIGVRALDSDPDGVIATEMRRDSPRLLDEDNFQGILDTFRDSRSGYMFVTNPAVIGVRPIIGPKARPLTDCRFEPTPQRLERGRYQVASANISSAPTGIPYYTEELFLEMMRTGRVKARKIHDAMPWIGYGRQTDEDLKATFVYLKTLPPVQHRVDNSVPPTDCPRCGSRHGAGALN